MAAVKFADDDDHFGIILTPAAGRHFYQFRLIVGGQIIGDTEPSIIGSAMNRLGHLHELSDHRLPSDLSDPDALMRLLQVDDELHDATTLSISESLDSWLLCGYRHDGHVFFVAREDPVHGTSGELLAVSIGQFLYDSIFEMAHIYWTKCEASALD
jgi:hypothetical protein